MAEVEPRGCVRKAPDSASDASAETVYSKNMHDAHAASNGPRAVRTAFSYGF
jgi:hypothetical protein